MLHTKSSPLIPADVAKNSEQTYLDNYNAITKETGRLFLFSCDQKIEHLNKDFYGPGIDPDAMHPEHLFKIANAGRIGAMAAHLGLIARYGRKYSDINYIVKLNAKTDLIPAAQQDPISQQLWQVEDALQLKKDSGLPIRGIGYTIYLGSEQEPTMLNQAAQAVYTAHQHGMLAILWIYVRGKSIKDASDAHLIAGATGLAASLGADFVKIKPPLTTHDLQIACAAAGTTKVICAGGSVVPPEQFLRTLHEQLQGGGSSGCATGRNIFQKSLPDAIAFTQAIAALIYDDADVDEALRIYKRT